MKIAVCVLTRANPAGLICALQTAASLASGAHDIKFYVRYDDDDEATSRALELIGDAIPITTVIGERPVTLGAAWNEMGRIVMADQPDAICPLGDDVFPIVQGWDLGVEVMLGDRGFDVFSWRELNNPTNITYPIVSRRWMEAVGELFCEHFPFWFSDTWLAQVYEFAKAEPVAIAADMMLGGKRSETQGMRDVAFWVDFWIKTQGMRIAEAQRIRRAMGWPDVDIAPCIEKFNRLDGLWNPEAIEGVHMNPNQGPPSERYLKAKERAEIVLAVYEKARAERIDSILEVEVFHGA